MFETQLSFDHGLYSVQALDQTSQAYSDHMSIVLTHGDSSSEGKFSVEGEDGPVIVDAFCNHVLFLSIQEYRRRGNA